MAHKNHRKEPLAVMPVIPTSPKLDELNDNFIEGVERMHAELQDFIQTKDRQSELIHKPNPFKATINELQRGSIDKLS
jgi:hypothetical protein